VSVQDLEISANRNLGGFEVAGEFGDQNPALTAQQIEYGAASFFVQHGNAGRRRRGAANGLCGSYFFYSVSFPLSTGKVMVAPESRSKSQETGR
jgi:hypothetical protein